MFSITRRTAASSLAFPDDRSTNQRRHHQDPDAMDVDGYNDLGEGPSAGPSNAVVGPGETITSSKEFMRGHGTYVEDEQVISSVTGTIDRVNKLISVRALKSRYTPEVGDLVIGRIVEVGSSRWKVDANARQDAVLMLSSVNLPGGVQRRKIESDALKMREFLAEGDLLVAEVQAFFQDGAMSLHTRSLKYGKLRNGMLLSVQPRLIRRLKSHFHHLPPPLGPNGVDVILGLNGYIWVASGTTAERREGGEGFDAEGVYSDKNDDISPESRQAIALVANVISFFASQHIPLSDTLLVDTHEWLTRSQLDGPSLSPEVSQRMLEEVVGVEVLAA